MLDKALVAESLTDFILDDFEVSIFLTELSSRHSILKKQKTFLSTGGKIKSNSAKMTGTLEEPVEIGENNGEDFVRQEYTKDGDGLLSLESIPPADPIGSEVLSRNEEQSHDESLFVSEDSEEPHFEEMPTLRSKKIKNPPLLIDSEGTEPQDEKKKSAFNTTYDGYSIYNRILCLVVKRKGQKGKSSAGGTGQAMMEEWITSTQAIGEGGMMDE